MLRIYCDESGINPESRFCVVAGFLGQVEHWNSLEEAWANSLSNHGLDCFHAADIFASGLSKDDIRQFIHQNARMPLHQLKDVAHYGNRNWPSWVDETRPDTLVPIVRDADDIVIIVAGGDGRHSAWLSGWGVTRMVTREIHSPA